MIVALVAALVGLPAGASAEQASQPAAPAAAQLDVSGGTDSDPSGHTCAVLAGGDVRCWGFGGAGRLGYASTITIGDDEDPGSVGPVALGSGHVATAISAGAFHTCARLDDGGARCWGFGGDGRLGYADTSSIGDDETPGSAGPVDVGPGRTIAAISAGGGHTCAVLDDGAVRCWGFGSDGRLGYGHRNPIGDDETPAAVPPLNFWPGRSATAISAGRDHNCALLDDASVRCWGYGFLGRLGYANEATLGDDETLEAIGPVNLGAGRSARAISAGNGHTCALLDDASVRCWGFGGSGRLGYANTNDIGDNEPPGAAGPVDHGPGRSARAISAGDAHSCALLDDGSVRCWGFGGSGRLGYANTNDIGDNESPGEVGPVDLGPGRSAVAISAGGRHTCARLDDGSVRCWGYGFRGRLGDSSEPYIGDDETPGSAAPVNLATSVCRATVPTVPPAPGPPPPGPAPPPPGPPAAGALSTAKLSIARATINRRERLLDVLAPITSLASGRVDVELHAAGRRHRFTAPVNARDGRIRFRQRIPAAQANLGTGILTISYRGDSDTRPQTVRLRAANRPAQMRLSRPTIASNGRLRASGTVNRLARGVVRVQIEYVAAGQTRTRQFNAPISNGRWSLNTTLTQAVRNEIAQRTGTVHSYTLFTGYQPARMRGEMRSFQVLGPR